MAFHLIHADGRSLLASDRPWLRASEKAPMEDAVVLLKTVQGLHERQEEALTLARTTATIEGRLVGEEEGRAAFAAAIADLTEQVQAEAERRDADIAALALAALRQMIGSLPDEEVMAGVARRAVEGQGSRGPVLVELSPAMLPHVERAFADRPSAVEVTLRAEDGLNGDQCRLTAPDGSIVADVAVQIASFAQRWEVDHAG